MQQFKSVSRVKLWMNLCLIKVILGLVEAEVLLRCALLGIDCSAAPNTSHYLATNPEWSLLPMLWITQHLRWDGAMVWTLNWWIGLCTVQDLQEHRRAWWWVTSQTPRCSCPGAQGPTITALLERTWCRPGRPSPSAGRASGQVTPQQHLWDTAV